MSFEQPINKKEDLRLEKLRIISILERDGLTDEAKEAYIKWTEEMERISISTVEMIEFNIDRAEFYRALGDEDERVNCLNEVLRQIQQEIQNDPTEHWIELKTEVENMIDN